jgi:aminoglycoside phosphotransferase (APT) family kinase protein
MSGVSKPTPPLRDVEAFLTELHGAPVRDVEVLSGGYWSSAFGYRVGDRELVVRLGSVREGFEADRAAMAFSGPDLPVPTVLDIGEGLGCSYAISERHHGRFLEEVEPGEADAVGPAIVRLLGALRAIPTAPDAPVAWQQPQGPASESTWRRWLTSALLDDPRQLVHGWRATLAADAMLDRLFRSCERRVHELAEACPERRDVVHGDLLHGNVLVSEDATRVTAVFSWKCSQRGDFLFDTAWCTFWAPWHPGIAAVDVWRRVLTDPTLTADPAALADAAVRHHCYELHIGATHLAWMAWTGDDDGLRQVAARTAEVLERGPATVPAPDGGGGVRR